MDQPQPVEPQPMPQTKPAMIRPWLLIVFLVVILLGGGYLGYYFWQKSQVKTTAPAITDAISTADWKTYTNDTYKFSFKYPANWEVNKTEITDSNLTEYVSVMAPSAGLVDPNDPKSKISISSEVVGIRIRRVEKWTELKSTLTNETIIKQSDKYAASYAIITGYTGSAAPDIYNKNIPALIKTFQFTE